VNGYLFPNPEPVNAYEITINVKKKINKIIPL